MGKLFGFNLVKARQVGRGVGGDVYAGGSDPNQEGRGIYDSPITPPFFGNNFSTYPYQYGGAVQTRRDRGGAEGDGGDDELITSASVQNLQSSSTARKKPVPPKPPPPTRGAVLYRDNDLQRFMAALGLNYRRAGKKTRAHQRLMGWKMHGSKAGDVRDNDLSRLIRQGKIFSVLNWKSGNKDLKFPPSGPLLRKYFTISNDLGYLATTPPTIAEAISRPAKRKKAAIKITATKGKGKRGKKTKTKTKRQPRAKPSAASRDLANALSMAENDVTDDAVVAGQSGSGIDWKTILGLIA